MTPQEEARVARMIRAAIASSERRLLEELRGELTELRDELYDADRATNARITEVHEKALRELTRRAERRQTA